MSDASSDQPPLFQNMDEQERIYAPQQVPGAAVPEDDPQATDGRDRIVGADGDASTATVVPVRPEVGITQPVYTPANPGTERVVDDEAADERA